MPRSLRMRTGGSRQRAVLLSGWFATLGSRLSRFSSLQFPDLSEGKADLWDSGKVTTSETLGIIYEGKPIAPNHRAFWKLKVWDKDGRESPWSESARWSTGLKPEDWKAEWVSFKDDQPVHADRTQLFLPAAHHFRKQFLQWLCISYLH